MRIFLLIIAICLLTSCSDREFSSDGISIIPDLSHSANITIDELKTDFANQQITDVLEITGQVISCDKEGNFYRSIFIEDYTGGIEIMIGHYGLYNYFTQGKAVSVVCKDLFVKNENGNCKLGYRKSEDEGNFDIDYFPSQEFTERHVFVNPIKIPIFPKDILLENIDPSDVGRIVCIKNVRFEKGGTDTWAKPAKYPQDYPASQDNLASDVYGNPFIVYVSGYSSFAKDTIPSKRVDVVGILTKGTRYYTMIPSSIKDITISDRL